MMPLSEVTFFDVNHLPVSRWRNGGGETREIIRQPTDDDGFAWRASIATITQEGDFSLFPGVDRQIALIEGAGVTLSFPAFSYRLQRGEPLFFAGETPLRARPDDNLVSRDFNIMTQRDSHYAIVISLHDALTLNGQDAGVLYVMEGTWQMGTHVCHAGQGIAWTCTLSARQIIPLTENAVLLYAAVFRR